MLLFYLGLLQTDGDKDKFTTLYSKYSKLLKHVALQKLNDDQLAEDAVHNAFLNIIKNFHMVGEVDSHKTKRLLVVVTENAAIDIRRKRQKYPQNSFDELEPVLGSSPDMLDGIAVRELMEMIAELPDIYRIVLEMRAFQGMSEKQIAAMLDISYEAARKRLERARAMLTQRMRRRQKGESYELL